MQDKLGIIAIFVWRFKDMNLFIGRREVVKIDGHTVTNIKAMMLIFFWLIFMEQYKKDNIDFHSHFCYQVWWVGHLFLIKTVSLNIYWKLC